MRTKTAGMFVVAILAMSATGCAAGTSGAGADSAVDVPSPELADDEMALSEEDSASRPSNEAAPTTAREFNGTEPNLTNRSNGGQRNDPYLPPQRNDPYLPPQAVVPDEPAPLPPTDADTAPSTPPETSERPRPSFPRPTDPVPLLPFPPFGANDTRPGQPADTGNDGTTDADGDDADADADAEGNPDVNPDAEADADGSPGDADGTADDSGARDGR